MNVLFLTLVKTNSLNDRGIYTDLLREFRNNGHHVYAVNPTERRNKQSTYLVSEEGADILHVKTYNIQKTNIIEKGIGTLAIENQYLRAIKKYFPKQKFDLILYSTPPITFSKVIRYIKKRDNAYSYLLLKDIFPQNAVDMKMLKPNGLIHKLFLKKEQELYRLSDTIGCMSNKNVSFLLKNNPSIEDSKVEVNPNSIAPIEITRLSEQDQVATRLKYGISLDLTVFVYGGNLGKPQGLDFLMETIEKVNDPKVYFLIVGSGTEFNRIQKWGALNQNKNVTILEGLPKTEYDKLLQCCDVGLIFLHKDFTIPNFPSRLLSYLEFSMPVIAATDENTDIGEVIEAANCGYSVISGDLKSMVESIENMCSNDDLFERMKLNARELLEKEYTVKKSYELIVEKLDY